MNTVRTFTALFDSTTEDDLITYYKPGTIPTPISSDRVASNLEYLNLVVNCPNTPVIEQWSGRVIAFYLKASGNTVEIARLSIRPAVVPYTFDLLTLLFGDRSPVISPDTELAAKVINAGYGLLLANETLTIYGSATEQIEFSNDTLVQQLV